MLTNVNENHSRRCSCNPITQRVKFPSVFFIIFIIIMFILRSEFIRLLSLDGMKASEILNFQKMWVPEDRCLGPMKNAVTSGVGSTVRECPRLNSRCTSFTCCSCLISSADLLQLHLIRLLLREKANLQTQKFPTQGLKTFNEIRM